MGGCRCTFRNCDNSTQNSPTMHFFHFPFRDLKRCEKWAEYSNNLAFLQLPINQLRNKVVCETHFKEPCFMNVKHERLTKFAVPTLIRSKTGEVVDLEIDQSNPTIYDVQKAKTSKHHEPPTFNSTIKLLNSRATKVQSSCVIRDEPTGSEFVDATTFEFTDQCQDEDMNEPVEIPEQTIIETEADEPTLLNGITLTKVEINRFDPDCESDAAPTYTKLKRKLQPVVKSKVPNDRAISKECVIKTDYDEPEIEYLDYTPKRSKLIETDNLVDKLFFSDSMERQKKEIADLKKIIFSKLDKLEDSVISKQAELLLQQAPAATLNANDKPNRNTIEAGPTKTKIQLFNGIKKYLNPSMVALLRMEMFGDTDRQYKSDEKSLAVELLNVQSNIYEYMRSELRFRLPPKKDAENWAKEMSENGREIDWEDEF